VNILVLRPRRTVLRRRTVICFGTSSCVPDGSVYSIMYNIVLDNRRNPTLLRRRTHSKM
jgi:hypothetical protein